MKKAIFIILALIILVLALNSCKCQHEWKEATCTEPKTCSSCGETEGERIQHTYTTGKCTDSQYCVNCNAKKEGFEHTWSDAECLSNKNCTVCGEVGEVAQHNWVASSCLEPRHCSKCDVTDGSPLGHSLVPVSCDETQVCLRCDETLRGPIEHSWQEATCKAPKTCLSCGQTEGKVADHAWKMVEQIEPSCANGKVTYLCVCGQTKSLTKSPIKEYHMCDENAYCPDCKTQFDQSKLTLESVVLSGGKVTRAGIFSSTEIRNKIYKTIVAADIGMPVVDLTGNEVSRVTSKTNPVTFEIQYDDGKMSFICEAELKVQGASSANYPKKNFSVKLLDENGDNKKVILDSAWGKAHKYCMKANYVDYSQARNVVSGKIYGDVITSREVKDELSELANGGAIDGFPIIVFNNGNFHGLYTMNIPKDKWMFDMDDSDLKNQAILMGESWTSSVAFRAQMPNNKISSGWELEFASNEDSLVDNNTDWVAESMNNLIKFVMENDGEAFKNGISEYADVDKCIDSMIYTFFICADDNVSKNILWVTYDGKVWFSSMYDMDGTWGMRWNGNIEFDENTHPISALADGKGLAPERNPSNYNLLWERIYINFYDKVVARYAELRKTALTYENIEQHFKAFFAIIPDAVRYAEQQKWTGVPSQDVDHLEQILEFARKRIIAMDLILLH